MIYVHAGSFKQAHRAFPNIGFPSSNYQYVSRGEVLMRLVRTGEHPLICIGTYAEHEDSEYIINEARCRNMPVLFVTYYIPFQAKSIPVPELSFWEKIKRRFDWRN